MGESEKKVINPNAMRIVKNLFICLFSLVCIINVGKVARTLTFLPLYLFGGAYYFLFALLFIFGLIKLFVPKVQTKKFSYIIASILLFAALFFIVSVALVPTSGDISSSLNAYHSNLGNYYNLTFVNALDKSSGYQGGLLGTLLSSLINNITVSVFIGVILILIALAIVFVPTVSKMIKNRSDKTPKEKKVAKPVKEEKKEEIKPMVEKEPVEVKPGFESDQEPFINENSGFSKPTVSLDDSYGVKYNQPENNEFTPLTFSKQKKVAPVSEPTYTSKPVVEVSPVEEEESSKEENLIETRPNEVAPQVEEVPELDESLVRAQPVFVAPEDDVDEVEEVYEEEPVPETPKKRERVVWIPPSTDLLATYDTSEAQELNEKVAASRLEAINRILADFRVGAKCTGYKIGPGITRYNIEYEPNVTVKSVERLVGDISMRLGGVATRFTPIVPNETFSGLEVPNAAITTVSFKEVVESLPDVKKHPLSVAFGKDISGNVIAADFNEFPHLLVAGTTGSGKSIYIHSIISTLIMRVSPDDLRIVLVDPKKVEMTKYRDMPHLLCPIITEAPKAKVMLTKLVEEMNNRYEAFAQNGSVSNIDQFNEMAEENNEEKMPYIIVVLDEYADLVDTCKDISQPVVSIAQKARAAGIHLLISTQRPSTNVITGVIKGNLPTHVALTTSNYTDSMTIIGEGGAETLQGKGDMLVQSPLVSRQGVTRLQGCYVQNKEIIHIVSYLKEHYQTYFDERFLDLVDHSKETAREMIATGEVQKEADEAEEMKYQSVKEWVLTQKFVSMSKIQRECQVGFNRAGKFFKRLQMEGVVDFEVDGVSKGCRVLVTNDDDNSDDSNIVTSEEVIS